MKINSKKSKWIIGIIIFIIAVAGTVVFFYGNGSVSVLTQSEYIKEVIVQNESFEDLTDKFLDQIYSYDGTKSSTEKIEATAAKFEKFVTNLEKQLGPRVPATSKSHYEKMIAAYKIHLEAVEIYKKAVPKNLGAERDTQLQAASAKLKEAQEAMKNLE